MNKTINEYLKDCEKGFIITNEQYSSKDEAYWESIMALANGYIGVRASLELASPGSLPGVYFAGVYDKPDKAEDGDLYGLSLKNKAITPSYAVAPQFHLMEIIANGRSVDFCNCLAMHFRRTLDMKRGLLFGEYSLKDKDGRVTEIKTMQAVSKANIHSALCLIEITPVNYAAAMTVRFVNSLNTHPQYIKRIKDYTSKTELVGLSESNGIVKLDAKVSETGTEISLAARTESRHKAKKLVETGNSSISEVFLQELSGGETVAFCKTAAFYTGRDCAKPADASIEALRKTCDCDTHLCGHIGLWREAWSASDIELTGHGECRLGLRWNIFSLLQLGSETDSDVSISATGLHGQGYFGHAFWDTEVFMLPFYLAANPKIARNLLLYRYNRLSAARALAAEKGCQGAKFPWTSTSKGFDSTPPDWERCANRQIHISGDIAYAFKNYYNWTGDADFFKSFGVEVIIETAKYYADRAARGDDGKYHILDVIGPDEYNIHANDNYFTNYLVCWNLREAVANMDWLYREDRAAYEGISEKTAWNDDVKSRLEEIADNLALPRTTNHVNEQYAGFFDLPEIGEIKRDEFNMPLDRSYHYDSGAQVLKQPDVVMLHYLFPGEFSAEVQKASYEYYERRCNHGSSLSPSIHCVQGLRCGLDENAFGYFVLSALLDLKNLHLDQNLDEGIHMACAGGSWACAVYGIGGVGITGGKLKIAPHLPAQLTGIRFSFRFRGRLFCVNVTKTELTVKLESGDAIEALVNGASIVFESGAEYSAGM